MRKWLCTIPDSYFAPTASSIVEEIVEAETRGKARAIAANYHYVEFITVLVRVYAGTAKPMIQSAQEAQLQ